MIPFHHKRGGAHSVLQWGTNVILTRTPQLWQERRAAPSWQPRSRILWLSLRQGALLLCWGRYLKKKKEKKRKKKKKSPRRDRSSTRQHLVPDAGASHFSGHQP